MASADRLIEVFNEAKARPAGPECAKFLDEACRNEPALKEQVRSLLQAHEGAGNFLNRRLLTSSTSLLTEKPGDKIGRYKLLEQIGEGGCGVVYMAEQEEPVRRRVALKVIKLGMDTKQVIGRFEAERQALALMDHPNIAKVFDAGATETGRPFFVMELVRGIRITDYCDQNNISTEERLKLFTQVCQAIQHAHQKGIIHRDIKPSNILVTVSAPGEPGCPKVIDFGIAKATTGERLTDKTVFTAFDQFIGTPAYMSPEQAMRTSLDIDTRTDIYALGVLLYELLTGTTPFDAKELMAVGWDAMRRIILEQEPQRPSTRLSTMLEADLTTIAKHRLSEPAKLGQLLRGDLDWIVMKALEKDRMRRYETASGLAADVQRHLSNEPVSARPPSSTYQFQKLVLRNQLVFATIGAVTMVLVAGVIVSSWQAVRATKAEKLAKDRLMEVAAERDAKEAARKDAEAISTFLAEVFQSPDPARDGRTITVSESLHTAAKKLETDLAGQPDSRAKLQETLGLTYNALGLYREAIPLLEQAREYHFTTCGPEHPCTLAATHNLANSYVAVGRREEALQLREKVLPLLRKVSGPEHPDTLSAMNNLANSYSGVGRREEALKLGEELLVLLRKVNGPEHPDTLLAMNNLSSSYHAVGRRDEALKLGEEVLALCRKVNGPEHPDTLRAMRGLAISYYEAGSRDEALKLREEELTLARKVLGPEHPDTLNAMNNLAISYNTAGRQDEALKLGEELLGLRRKVSGPEHPDTLRAMGVLANSYERNGRRDEAFKLREEVLALDRKVFGPEHPDTLSAMNNLAASYQVAGRQGEALTMREDVLALRRKVLGPEHPDTLKAMDVLAISYEAVDRQKEALKLREEALELRGKVSGRP